MLVRNDRLHMVAGGWELQAEPARGGAITSLRLDGRDVMVSPQPNPDDAMGSASFAMVPYANRIASGRFLYLGQRWQLPLNFGDHPHPLHGTGWKRPWSVTARDHGSVTWELHHEADAHWPWPFTAHQTFRLDPEGLHISLSVTNEASCCVPVGVGFHPAFAAPPGTVFETRVEGSWTIDADIIPISPVTATSILPEIGGQVPLPRATLLDHCFTRWSRRLRILPGGDSAAAIEISASPEMEYLHLYAKPGADWFIAEPVSQMPDAIHHPEVPAHGGLRFLQPAETFSVWMRVGRARA